jgi:phosphoglycerate dehydrogenase-like enzyme
VTTVWLPESPESFGGLPGGMTADVWTGGGPLPDSAGQVEVVVMPFRVRPELIAKVAQLPNLKLIQLRSAGAEAVLPYVPDHVTLCNARGAHDPATAEWVVGTIVAHLRNLPRFAMAQQEGRWDPVLSESVAGVTVDRVARRARPGTQDGPAVKGTGELPDVLPRADVVVLLVPVTDETRGMADAKFLAAMKDGALLVNAARGSIVDTGALLTELNSGRLRAALDVTEHVGGMVPGGITRANAVVRAQLGRYAVGEPLANVITDQGY